MAHYFLQSVTGTEDDDHDAHEGKFKTTSRSSEYSFVSTCHTKANGEYMNEIDYCSSS